MSQTERIKKEYEKSLALFRSGSTLPKQARLDALTRLDVAMRRHQDEILAALSADLNKSFYEGYMTELAIVLGELNLAKNKLGKWMRNQNKNIP